MSIIFFTLIVFKNLNWWRLIEIKISFWFNDLNNVKFVCPEHRYFKLLPLNMKLYFYLWKLNTNNKLGTNIYKEIATCNKSSDRVLRYKQMTFYSNKVWHMQKKLTVMLRGPQTIFVTATTKFRSHYFCLEVCFLNLS